MAWSIRCNEYDLWLSCSYDVLICMCVAAKRRKEILGAKQNNWYYATNIMMSLMQLRWMTDRHHPLIAAFKADMTCLNEEEAECFFGLLAHQSKRDTNKAAHPTMNKRFKQIPLSLGVTNQFQSYVTGIDTGLGDLGREKPLDDVTDPQNEYTRNEFRRVLLRMVDEITEDNLQYGRDFHNPARGKVQYAIWFDYNSSTHPLAPIMRPPFMQSAVETCLKNLKRYVNAKDSNSPFNDHKEAVEEWFADNPDVLPLSSESEDADDEGEGPARQRGRGARGARGAGGGRRGGGPPRVARTPAWGPDWPGAYGFKLGFKVKVSQRGGWPGDHWFPVVGLKAKSKEGRWTHLYIIDDILHAAWSPTNWEGFLPRLMQRWMVRMVKDDKGHEKLPWKVREGGVELSSSSDSSSSSSESEDLPA